jgi:hypothetical protein
MVLQENLRPLDESLATLALRLRPVVVDGRLRGQDEKGRISLLADELSERCI